ncbi:hypothetical protein [Latilactobacillus fragifolii]|uniref:hypothetical protein n=1 Tax=Latilactobacillus fragifolii TaxID=2814244 RepID=UPI001ABB1CBA|nr:hypothetical protein [Latilactobacillus fragifolii]
MATKTGTKLDQWQREIIGLKQFVSEVSTVKDTSVTKTDMEAFKEIHELSKNFNTSLKQFKAYVDADGTKMMKAAKNKHEDDRQGAATMRKGG